MELAYLHDWNVIYVPTGSDFRQILIAQRMLPGARQRPADRHRLPDGQRLEVRHRGSRVARRGTPLCSEGFYAAVAPLAADTRRTLPACEKGQQTAPRARTRW